MGMMPIVFGWNILAPVICIFDFVRLAKFRNRFIDAARHTELVPIHVVGMRNCWCEPCVNRALIQRLIHWTRILEGMGKIVVADETIGREGNRGLVKRNRVDATVLSVSNRGSFIGKTAQYPKKWVARICR